MPVCDTGIPRGLSGEGRKQSEGHPLRSKLVSEQPSNGDFRVTHLSQDIADWGMVEYKLPSEPLGRL